MTSPIEMHVDVHYTYITLPPKLARAILSKMKIGSNIFASVNPNGALVLYVSNSDDDDSFCDYRMMEYGWMEIELPSPVDPTWLFEDENKRIIFDPITIDSFDVNRAIDKLKEDGRFYILRSEVLTGLRAAGYKKEADSIDTTKVKSRSNPVATTVTDVEPQRHNGGWMRWDGSIISKEIALLQSAMCINSYIDAGEAEVFIKDGRIVVASKTLKYL